MLAATLRPQQDGRKMGGRGRWVSGFPSLPAPQDQRGTKVGNAKKGLRCPLGLGSRCHSVTGDRDLRVWPWGVPPTQVASDPPHSPPRSGACSISGA